MEVINQVDQNLQQAEQPGNYKLCGYQHKKRTLSLHTTNFVYPNYLKLFLCKISSYKVNIIAEADEAPAVLLVLEAQQQEVMQAGPGQIDGAPSRTILVESFEIYENSQQPLQQDDPDGAVG